jgi:hypothetical protein
MPFTSQRLMIIWIQMIASFPSHIHLREHVLTGIYAHACAYMVAAEMEAWRSVTTRERKGGSLRQKLPAAHVKQVEAPSVE